MNASSPFQHTPASTLVTGASSGIGFEIALQLAQAGTPVIALGRDAQRLQTLAARHGNIRPLVADLADTSALAPLVTQLLATHGRIDCVIHNAALQHEMRFDDPASGRKRIDEELDVNLRAPLHLTHALLPHLLAQPRASIVTVSSILAHMPKANAAVYSATKAGLHLFSEALRVQLAGTTVRVMEVVMPLVDTPMTAGRGQGKMRAEDAARRLIAGLHGPRDTLWIGKAAAARVLLRAAPWLMRRILQRG